MRIHTRVLCFARLERLFSHSNHAHIYTAVDTAKTVLQIDSVEGFRSLMRRVRGGKVGLLYSGAIANAVSAILGHYPWVCCMN
jgi:hypothetical protein